MFALYFRLTIPETPRFTMDIDRKVARATRDIENALAATAYTIYANDDSIHESRVTAPRATGSDFIAYFSKLKNLKVLFGTAYSWFALDVRTWDNLAMQHADLCVQIAFYILTLDSPLILDSTRFGGVDNDAYKSLRNFCVGNIVLVTAGFIPGFAASFLLIDVWGRKPIQLMGFVVLTILFWIMGMFIGNHV